MCSLKIPSDFQVDGRLPKGGVTVLMWDITEGVGVAVPLVRMLVHDI